MTDNIPMATTQRRIVSRSVFPIVPKTFKPIFDYFERSEMHDAVDSLEDFIMIAIAPERIVAYYEENGWTRG